MEGVFQIIIIVFALIGLWASGYICYKKAKKEAMVCHLGGKCENVLYSKWNKTFGMSNEYGGLAYYSLVIILAALSLAGTTTLFSIDINLIFLIIAGGAFLFSIYLVYLQAYVIKDWCQYCLVSAFATTGIFVTDLIYFLL